MLRPAAGFVLLDLYLRGRLALSIRVNSHHAKASFALCGSWLGETRLCKATRDHWQRCTLTAHDVVGARSRDCGPFEYDVVIRQCRSEMLRPSAVDNARKAATFTSITALWFVRAIRCLRAGVDGRIG